MLGRVSAGAGGREWFIAVLWMKRAMRTRGDEDKRTRLGVAGKAREARQGRQTRETRRGEAGEAGGGRQGKGGEAREAGKGDEAG